MNLPEIGLNAMNGRSFISYSVQDAGLASAVYAFLKSNGHDAVKAPEDIALGEDWAASIASLIEHSDYFILLWTHNSMSSKEVAKELTLAMDCGSKIIPFRAEDLSPEGAWRYHLMNVQWLEAHAMPEAAALEALLTYFRRTQKENWDHKSAKTKVSIHDQNSIRNENTSQMVGDKIPSEAKSIALELVGSEPKTIDADIELEENQHDAANANDEEFTTCSSQSLEALNHEKLASKNAHSSLVSWQFIAAVEIACTLGHSVEAASDVHSKRTFLGYRLCDNDGITITLIPLAMIDSKKPSPARPIIDKCIKDESEVQKLGGGLSEQPLFSSILDIAKKMGYSGLDTACEAESHKGLINFVIKNSEGKVLAKIPLSMVNNRIH